MNDKLVTIAQYTDYIEAEMAKQLLADYKIEAVVTGDNAANLYPISAVAAIDLQVLEKNAQQAREILESREKQEQ
ncbi:MAG: putative signal transducing protein [Planctomycetota bacterium]